MLSLPDLKDGVSRARLMNRQQRRAAGKAAKLNRNDLAKREFAQYSYRKDLLEGDPCEYEEALTDCIRSHMHFDTLVYGWNTESASVFEKLTRAMRVVAALYGDEKVSAMCNATQKAIEKLRDDDSSPNQRRVMLRPLILLAEMAYQYAQILPEQAHLHLASYCSAVQVALYTPALFDTETKYLKAMNAIINGESLRSLAKQMGEKENVLREKVLDTAYLLYRVVECFEYTPEINGIPDLRNPIWKKYTDHAWFEGKIKQAINGYLIPFEERTGISLIDVRQYESNLNRIKARHKIH